MPTANDAKLSIREIDRVADASALSEFDTSFTSDFIYTVASERNALQLQLFAAPSPTQKQFPFNLNDPPWNQGYVAVEDGKLCGWIATRYEPWNRRLAITHFYVDQPYRRRGVGRRLLERAMGSGRLSGARTAWVETSNINYPGILAYQRLGFSLCGFDLTLYRGTTSEGEFAVYLARQIAMPCEARPAE